MPPSISSILFFFNATATTEIYTLSLHDALPISHHQGCRHLHPARPRRGWHHCGQLDLQLTTVDRKSTRLNSSHVRISYAVFCLKKKKNPMIRAAAPDRIHLFTAQSSYLCFLSR